MARRRKGYKYTPELPVLLRDAQPTWHEIHGEQSVDNRHERSALATSARDALIMMYRDAKKRGTLARLDIRVRNFCDAEMVRNRRLHRRRLPLAKGGRPTDQHRRLLIAIEVQEEIERRRRGGERHGSVKAALTTVADRACLSYDQVRDIHYVRDLKGATAVEFRQALAIEFHRRRCHALWFWDVQEDWITPNVFGEGNTAWWRPSLSEAPSIWAKGV